MTEARGSPKRNEFHDMACRVDGYLAVLQNQHVHLVRSFEELEVKLDGLLSAQYVTELVKYVLCLLLTTSGHERDRVMWARETDLGSLWQVLPDTF